MLYKAVLNGECHGQKIQNTLWYRTGVGIEWAGFTMGGSGELAEEIKNQVWPVMKPCMPSSYKLNDISVYPYDHQTLKLMYQVPHIQSVLENGTSSAQTDGTAISMIIRMNLEPVPLLANGLNPPKRGYVCVGPISSLQIDDSGHLIDDVFLNLVHPYKLLADKLAADLIHVTPPIDFFPIRVASKKLLGLVTIDGWADVSSCTIRRLTTFRRSRMAEA